jgi:predicted AlkP superfamily pyrophosphatase or phosphodiesterase
MMKRFWTTALVGCLSSALVSCHRVGGERPALAVLIVVDQLRGGSLSRATTTFDSEPGGLARLLREGMVFEEAHHPHATTETCPGHASIATGLPPAAHGIIGNGWYDRASGVHVACVGDPDEPSARYLDAPTIADWLRKTAPGARIVAVAGKDRAAIMSAGRSGDGVFWYSPELGRFITSRFYASEEPEILRWFAETRPVSSFACSSWERIDGPRDLAVADPDDSPWEPEEVRVFPHPLPCDRPGSPPDEHVPDTDAARRAEIQAKLFSEVRRTPFLDDLTLDLAEAALDRYDLGQDGTVDLLMIGLSATDSIGHRYGPESQEFLDQIRRLDRRLGRFLKTLDEKIGRNRTIVALTGDHGVASLPERDTDAETVRFPYEETLDRLKSSMEAQLGPGAWIEAIAGTQVYLARPADGNALADSYEKIETAAFDALSDEEAIARAYTRSELTATGEVSRNDPYHSYMSSSWTAGRGGDIMVRIKPGCLITDYPTGTTHGTPYRYDTHVELLIWGPGVQAGRSGERVSVLQIAPTIAGILGVSPPRSVTATPLPLKDNR